MTILATIDVPGSRADLEALSAALEARQDPPEGLIVHIGISHDGGVRAVDVWESEEHLRRFLQDRLGPTSAQVMAERGVPMEGEPQITVTEAFDLVRGR